MTEEKALRPVVTIKAVDMSPDMQAEVIGLAKTAMRPDALEKDVAAEIKKELDRKYGITWHCIVGKSFGSYVTHETNNFIYFYVDRLAVLAYKTS